MPRQRRPMMSLRKSMPIVLLWTKTFPRSWSHMLISMRCRATKKCLMHIMSKLLFWWSKRPNLLTFPRGTLLFIMNELNTHTCRLAQNKTTIKTSLARSTCKQFQKPHQILTYGELESMHEEQMLTEQCRLCEASAVDGDGLIVGAFVGVRIEARSASKGSQTSQIEPDTMPRSSQDPHSLSQPN